MPLPELKTPVVIITRAVMVQITTVSINGSSKETMPSVAGSLVLTAECAPILIYDKNLKINSIIHAGWKGALRGL